MALLDQIWDQCAAKLAAAAGYRDSHHSLTIFGFLAVRAASRTTGKKTIWRACSPPSILLRKVIKIRVMRRSYVGSFQWSATTPPLGATLHERTCKTYNELQ